MTLYTVAEAAEILKRSKGTIYNWIHLGIHCGPRFKKIGSKPMISEKDLKEWYEEI